MPAPAQGRGRQGSRVVRRQGEHGLARGSGCERGFPQRGAAAGDVGSAIAIVRGQQSAGKDESVLGLFGPGLLAWRGAIVVHASSESTPHSIPC